MVEPGSYLKKSGGALNIIKDKKVIDTIPAQGLQKIVISGYVSLTGAVIDFCINNRIETVFITPRGRFRGRLMIDEHRHVALRQAQYLKLTEEKFCRETMTIIVKGKIENMAAFLLRRTRNIKEDKIRVSAARLKGLSQYLSEPLSKEAIRGVEGAASRIYFMRFNDLIKNSDFAFRTRSRRPPLDPVNAMLSFVYTMLTNEVLSAIKISGLDPYKGSLHEISYGRPSLACDLVEEYRSLIGDRLVLNLINRNMVKLSDFIIRKQVKSSYIDEEDMKRHRPVEMKPYLCRAFIASYEKMMSHGTPSFRNVIRNQVRQFADYLLDREKSYKTISV